MQGKRFRITSHSLILLRSHFLLTDSIIIIYTSEHHYIYLHFCAWLAHKSNTNKNRLLFDNIYVTTSFDLSFYIYFN